MNPGSSLVALPASALVSRCVLAGASPISAHRYTVGWEVDNKYTMRAEKVELLAVKIIIMYLAIYFAPCAGNALRNAAGWERVTVQRGARR